MKAPWHTLPELGKVVSPLKSVLATKHLFVCNERGGGWEMKSLTPPGQEVR